jgi:hypothetical protein
VLSDDCHKDGPCVRKQRGRGLHSSVSDTLECEPHNCILSRDTIISIRYSMKYFNSTLSYTYVQVYNHVRPSTESALSGSDTLQYAGGRAARLDRTDRTDRFLLAQPACASTPTPVLGTSGSPAFAPIARHHISSWSACSRVSRPHAYRTYGEPPTVSPSHYVPE